MYLLASSLLNYWFRCGAGEVMKYGTQHILHSLRSLLQAMRAQLRFGETPGLQSELPIGDGSNQFDADHFVDNSAWIDPRRVPLYKRPNGGPYGIRVAYRKLASSFLCQALCFPSMYDSHDGGSCRSCLRTIERRSPQQLCDVVPVNTHPDR